MQVTPKLRRSSVGYIFYCPGCEKAHHYYTDEGTRGGAVWQFDGNLDSPTFTPSYRVFDEQGTICHLFLTRGQLQFLGDCRHALRGQTVPLPDLPAYMQGDEFGDGNPAPRGAA